MTFRQMAALGVAVVGIESVLSAATPNLPARERIVERVGADALPSVGHLLALVAGLALVLLAANLWRGIRKAVPLAIAGLLGLAVLNLVKGLDFEESALDLCLCALLAAGRGAFPLGCRNRPRLAAVFGAVGAWALAYCALLTGPLVADRGRTLRQVFHHTIRAVWHGSHLSQTWVALVEALLATAIVTSLLAVRSWLRPAEGAHTSSQEEYRAARALVERDGEDSLSRFILRPDKVFHFAAGGVLAYRMIGETAIVSGDPVAPDTETARELVASFVDHARAHGWEIVLWGASREYLNAYRELGMRALCVGEEAFVRPADFTLEGRRVRKLRQSVRRVERRGWEVSVCRAQDLDRSLQNEIDALEAAWRSRQRRIIGFAMGMGPWDPESRPGDIHVLGRAPDGELRAVMRFAEHRGRLSLDTMHRVGETPNGLNEALVCHALEWSRDHDIPEVSLNYAGLGHLLRDAGDRGRVASLLGRALSSLLGQRFQLARLVRFDQKFQPEWRPRFLVYESLAGLPRAAFRVLQVEGYIPRWPARRRPEARSLPGWPHADAAR